MHTKTKISVADPDPGSNVIFTSESGIRIRDGEKSGSGIIFPRAASDTIVLG